ncbi:MAG: hypothetical protein ABW212_22080, partial [Pseudonocardia sediminis]
MTGTPGSRAPDFVEPTADVFRYSGWAVDPPSMLPLVRPSARREAHVARLRAVENGPGVSATTFETVLIPPLRGVPRLDVVRLERSSGAGSLPTGPSGPDLPEPGLVLTATVARQFGDTERTWDATFLFNHFTAPSADVALGAWERVAGWYASTMGVDNSTLLLPHAPSPFAIVNYVRIPTGAARFLVTQIVRPSFHRDVRRVLDRAGMRYLPILAR